MTSWRACVSAGLPVAVCVSALAMGGCDSPTLPLPPPNDPKNFVVSDDHTSIAMDGTGAVPGALVFVFNEDVGKGQIVVAGALGDYHVSAPLDLSRYDQNWFLIWQHYSGADSEIQPFAAPPRYGPGSLGWMTPGSEAGAPSDAGADAE